MNPLGHFARAYLLLLVVITGAVVLALEVLGTRVIGTHYGGSLYVWAALLTVTMVCLAVGYAIGGRLADRFPTPTILFALVIAAGLAVLAVPWLTSVLVPLGDALGLAGGAIASAAIIFSLPLTLLAMAGPYVIRLRARLVERVGGTSGAVYALSTAGSVAGVLAVSLWMIPSLGTRTSLLVCAGLLIAVGALGAALSTRGKAAPLLLLAVLPALAHPVERPVPGELFRTESPYGELRVIQRDLPGRGPYRMLMVNGIMQTGMPLDIELVGPGAILQSDSYYLELLPYFHADLGEGRRGVLIGLAGGMFPRVMEFYNIDWTAVEIDARVAELAKAYFGYRGPIANSNGTPHEVDLALFPRRELPASHVGGEHEPAGMAGKPPYRGRAVIQDGRWFLQQLNQPVDFLVLDAYSSDTIPFHLITREFFELARSRLTDDGVLAINYIGRPEGDPVTASLLRTLAAVFGPGNLRAFRTTDDPSAVQVIIIFAMRRPMDLLPLWRREGTGVAGAGGGGADRLSYELTRRAVPISWSAGVVFTDDRNASDLARVETALQWRRQTRASLE
jgi:MFS family permease